MHKFRAVITLVLLGLMVLAAYVLLPTQDTFSLKETANELGSKLSNLGGLNPELNQVATEVTQQATSLTKDAGNVLGTISSDKSDQPLHEKAFEYGRYEYCKQVISDYEARQNYSKN